MPTQPDSLQLTAAAFDTVEVIDTGDAIVLLQPDETGEVQSIALSRDQLAQLFKYLEA